MEAAKKRGERRGKREEGSLDTEKSNGNQFSGSKI